MLNSFGKGVLVNKVWIHNGQHTVDKVMIRNNEDPLPPSGEMRNDSLVSSLLADKASEADLKDVIWVCTSVYVSCPHPLLKQVNKLLYALIHTAGVRLQHQLWSLGLLILRINASET